MGSTTLDPNTPGLDKTVFQALIGDGLSGANAVLGLATPPSQRALSPVASRVELANSQLSGGTAAGVTSFEAYRIQQDCFGFVVTYTNRQITTAGEIVPANGYTVKSTIEIAGVLTPVTFGGARAQSVAPGAEVDSDVVPLSVAAGTWIILRTYRDTGGADTATRVAIISGDYNIAIALGEGIIVGADHTDTATASLPAKNTSNRPYGPSAIRAVTATSRPSAVILGSSTAWGQGDTSEAPYYDAGYLARICSANGIAYSKAAVAGDLLASAVGASYVADFAKSRWRRDHITKSRPSFALSYYGQNDWTGGATLAQMKDLLTRLWDMYAGLRLPVVQTTYNVVATSSNNFIDAAGQTVHAQNSVRVALNDWVRTRPHAAIIGILDTAPLVEDPANPGKFKTDGTANKWTPDGQHLSQYGHQQVAAAMAPVLKSIVP